MEVCVYQDPTMYGTHGITAAFNQQRKALKENDVKVIEKPNRSYEVIHLNWPGPISLLRLKQAKRKGKLGVVFAHSGEDVKGGFTLSYIFARPFIRWLTAYYKSGDLIITPSQYAKNMISDFGVSRDKVRVVSNGVDTPSVQFSRQKRKKYRNRFQLNRPTVIGVGQVIPRKGIVTFIDVASKLPQYQFVWFGHKMNKLFMYDREMNKAMNNAPPNVIFTGYVDDIQAAYSAGDLFFFPSLEENQGIVLLEAAVRGIPIVARSLPVYEGWLKDGVHCLKGNNTQQFVDHIRKLQKDRKLRSELVDNASKMAQGHRLEKVGQRYLELYKQFS